MAEIAATWATCSLPATGIDIFFSSPTSNSTPLSMPRFKAIASAPAAMFLKPSAMMACATMVDVLVPSPHWSLVLVAACFTNCTPMFS